MKFHHAIIVAAAGFLAASPVFSQTTDPGPTVVTTTVQQPAPATQADVKQREQELKRARRDVSETRRDEREAARNVREDKREMKQAIRDKRELARNKREDERDRNEYNEKLQRPALQPLEVKRDTLRY